MSTFEQVISGKGKFRHVAGYEIKEHADRVKCADGVTLSVQASEYHYCTPRTNHGPYYRVEVGFPSIKPPDSWARYADYGDVVWDEAEGTDIVYGYIPVELVREFI